MTRSIPFVSSDDGGSWLLWDIINELGLETGLGPCLDAGDLASYDGTSQSWVTRSPNPGSFYRGSGSGSDGADPTFVGTAGEPDAYFQFDGADYFSETSTLQIWGDTAHQNNGSITVLAVVYATTASAVRALWATQGNVGSNSGVALELGLTGTTVFLRRSYTTTLKLNEPVSSDSYVENSWNLVAASFDEASATGATQVNANSESHSSLQTSTDTDACSYPNNIGRYGDGNRIMHNGDRIMCLAGWGGVALSAANLNSIYTLFKARRGIALP